jgi:hypothetical protein
VFDCFTCLLLFGWASPWEEDLSDVACGKWNSLDNWSFGIQPRISVVGIWSGPRWVWKIWRRSAAVMTCTGPQQSKRKIAGRWLAWCMPAALTRRSCWDSAESEEFGVYGWCVNIVFIIVLYMSLILDHIRSILARLIGSLFNMFQLAPICHFLHLLRKMTCSS